MYLKKAICLYIKYASVCVKSAMQYKTSFALMITARFIIAFCEFLAISFLFSGLRELKGYTYTDVLLCFSIIHISFVLAELFGNGFQVFSGTIKRGEFDRMLLRPCGLILQVMGTKFELGRTGPLLTAALTLFIAIRNGGIIWGIMQACTLLFMILGGTLLFLSLFLLGASFCFYSIEDTSLLNVLTYGAKSHGKYPIDVYGPGILRFCTYVIPYTLIQYYPLQYLLGKTDRWYYAFYPLAIPLFFAVCYLIWRIGVRNYKSCGS